MTRYNLGKQNPGPTSSKAKTLTEANEFRLWVKYARRGQWCRYWQGHLAFDREAPSRTLLPDAAWQFMARADEVADAAWRACKAGKCMLFQRRNPICGWDYLAVKT
jgi:hypothetical protein